MARKPQAYGDTVYRSQTSGGGGWGSGILNPNNEDNILRLFNPRREDNIIRRMDPKRDDNIIRSLLGINAKKPAPPVTVGRREPSRPATGGFTPPYRQSRPAPPYSFGRTLSQQPEEDIPGFEFGQEPPRLEDFLSQVQSLFQSQSSGVDNRRAAMEANRTASLGSISAATEALAQQLAASRQNVDSRYTQGINEAAAANTEAQQALAQQHAATQAQEQELYKNLGIAVDNSRAADDTSYGQGALATLGSARDTEQRSRQLTDYTLGSRSMDAARMRGVENQAAYQRDFQNQLAALLDEQEQLKSQAANQALSLYGDARSQYNNDRSFAYGKWQNEQEWARQDARDQLDYEMQMAQAQADAQGELNPQDALMQQLQGYGVTPGKAQQWLARLYGNLGTIKSNPQQFSKIFGNASPQAQAALYNYLLSSGAIGKG